MAKCIVCGRKLVTEESMAIGIGKECLSKARKAGTNSRGNRWTRRVERTIGFFARGSFDIGNTKYLKIDNNWLSYNDTGVHSQPDWNLKKWLETKGQIIRPDEVPEKIYDLLKSGKSAQEILDKTLEV
jgi:hypothetical protein